MLKKITVILFLLLFSISCSKNMGGDTMNIKEIIMNVNNYDLVIELIDNSSSRALIEKLKEGDIIVRAHDYGNFEKVGNLGFSLPTNDKRITTKPGDLILYQGNQLTIYYDTNTWTFTKLGEVVNVDGEKLKEILGKSDAILTLKKVN